MNKIILLILIIASTSFAQDNTSAERMNFDNAVRIALENNYSIRLSKKNSEIAENNAFVGNAGMLPKVDLRGGYNYSVQDITNEIIGQPEPSTSEGAVTKVTNYSAELGWTLFDGFGMFLNYDKLNELKDKSQIELQITIEEMIRNVASSYYNVLRLEQDLSIAEENIDLTLERLTRARNRSDFGSGTSLEVLRAKVDMNVDSTIYLQTEIAYRNSQRALNFALGRDITTDVLLDTNIQLKEISDYPGLENRVLESNNSIANAIKEKQISEIDHDLVIASMWPRIQGTASYSYSKNESDGGFLLLSETDGISLGLNASVNLFNGLQTQIRRQNAKVRKEMTEIQFDQIKSSVLLNLRNTYETYVRRLDIYNMQQENLQAAELNFERTQELFRLGRQTSIELRDAQLNLLNAKQRINSALFDVKLSEIELLLLSNDLLD